MLEPIIKTIPLMPGKSGTSDQIRKLRSVTQTIMMPQDADTVGKMNQHRQQRDSDEAPDRQDLMNRVTAAHFLDDGILDRKLKLAARHDRDRQQLRSRGGGLDQLFMIRNSWPTAAIISTSCSR